MQSYILLVGLIITILAYSGFGDSIHISENLTYVGWVAIIYWLLNIRKFDLLKANWICLPTFILSLFFLGGLIQSWQDISQLTNFTTLFGMVIGTSILSKINWSAMDFFKSGLILWLFSWMIIQMLLPGRPLSGWNPNSAICVVPCLMCGLCLIYISKKRLYFYGCLVLSVAIVLTMENRSSLISLLIFGFLSIPYVFDKMKNRTWFRVFYIGALVINVGFPLFNDVIGHWGWYNDLVSVSQEFTGKDGGFSGRDSLWRYAILCVAYNPLFGSFGARMDIYFHNFSCDVLLQFGWFGWITFALSYIYLMESCYYKVGKSNIFLLAFVCLIILNTFENALLANGHFTIFPYFLFAVACNLKTTNQTIQLSK